MSTSIEYLQLLNIDITDSNGEYRGQKYILEDVSEFELIKRITINNPVRAEEVASIISELRQYIGVNEIKMCYEHYGYGYLVIRLDIYRLTNNVLKPLEKLREAFIKAANEISFIEDHRENHIKNYKKRNKKGKQIKNWQKKNFYD